MNDLQLEEFVEFGQDAGCGNLLGVQPYLVPADYAAPERLYDKLDAYLSAAAQRGWLNEKTVAVFPEYTGAWLAAAGEKPGIYRAGSLNAAMRALALAHPFRLGWGLLLSSAEKDRSAAALFRALAGRMARLYQKVFSALAKRRRVTLVAGSTVLPRPCVRQGRLTTRAGPLYNVSAVFRPDGSLYPQLVRKVYPVSAELPFIHPGCVEDIPVFDTPAGRLGVLVCADSWYPQPYRQLASLGVELVVVPSFIPEGDAWERPWQGYSGAAMPPGVDPGDAGSLTEGQAWRAHALAGRLASSGARCGLNVFLRGRLWDMPTSGRSVLVQDGETFEATRDHAALLNLWLAQR